MSIIILNIFTNFRLTNSPGKRINFDEKGCADLKRCIFILGSDFPLFEIPAAAGKYFKKRIR